MGYLVGVFFSFLFFNWLSCPRSADAALKTVNRKPYSCFCTVLKQIDNCKACWHKQSYPIVVVTWVGTSLSKSAMLAHVSFWFVFNDLLRSKAGSRGRVGCLISLLRKPVYMGERIVIKWGWWEWFVMPIIMESSMFCFSISRLISNYASVGLNIV